MSYLDGLKKTLEDEDFARKTETKYTKISDAKVLAENYQQGLRVWNKDMSVDPAAIRIVLDESSDPKAKTADPKRGSSPKRVGNNGVKRGLITREIACFNGQKICHDLGMRNHRRLWDTYRFPAFALNNKIRVIQRRGYSLHDEATCV